MSKFKKYNNLKKILIIIFMILLSVVIVCFIVVKKLKVDEKNNFKDELILTDPVYISEEKEKIYPENSFQLVYTYSGSQKLTDDFYKKIYSFESFLHILYDKNINEDQIQDFFNSNMELIKSKTGITELSNFQKLMENINSLNNGLSQLKKAIFKIDEKNQNQNYTICPLIFQYSDNNELIFDLYISNSNAIKPLLKFIPR